MPHWYKPVVSESEKYEKHKCRKLSEAARAETGYVMESCPLI
jgi:hypothetical protein